MPEGTSVAHVGGGDNPALAKPLVTKYSGKRPQSKGFEWSKPTPESEAFWRQAAGGTPRKTAARATQRADRRGTPRPTRRKYDHEEALRRYGAGQSAREIAEALGTSATAIHNLASKAGVKRGQGYAPTVEETLPEPVEVSGAVHRQGTELVYTGAAEDVHRELEDQADEEPLDLTHQAHVAAVTEAAEPHAAPADEAFPRDVREWAKLLDDTRDSTSSTVLAARATVLVALSTLDMLANPDEKAPVPRKKRGQPDDPDLVETVRRMYVEEGLSQEAIGQRVGRTQAYIWRLMKRHGIEIVRRRQGRAHRRIDIAAAADICRRYIDGESSIELATAYRVSGPTIIYHLRKAGVRIRDKSEANHNRKPGRH